jgi:hypothetical protein
LVTHHDATHGGRVTLPDSIIIEKAKLIAAEANLELDPENLTSPPSGCTRGSNTTTCTLIFTAREKL